MQSPSRTSGHTLRIPLKVLEGKEPSLLTLAVREFLLDRQARNAAPGTLRFYRQKLRPFLDFLEAQGVTRPDQVTPAHLRRFLVSLQEAGHNPGGQHGYFRAARAFLRWAVAEGELEANPALQVRPPKVPEKLLEPVNLQHVKRMLAVCDPRTELGCRDRSVILALLDTGARAGEVTALNVGDADLASGTLLIRRSKGNRPRAAFLGRKALKALLKYLRCREGVGPDAPLWATENGGRLSYAGLRDILRRRAKDAGVPAPPLHAFRRAFALLSLRNGCDVYSLQRLMGHADLSVLRRYLAQTEEDLQRAHQQYGPVD
ncbi:MAG: tyrosine-type recombinase/integrase, partial [Anaerolineae bacterium]